MLKVDRGSTHEYIDTDTDLRLFSVSQIRKVAHDPFVGVPPEVLSAARYRGTLLHARFWRLLASQVGLLAHPLVIEGLEGFCESMDEWVKRNQVMPVKIEEPSLSIKFGFAGTPDALVRFGRKRRLTLIDLKTGQVNVTDPMQLLAYHKMDGYEEAVDLLDVYVQADGSYAVEKPVTAGMKATEWAWFLSALGVLQSRVNHGVRS